VPGGRQFEVAEVEELLTQRTIGPLQGFRSKMGRPFAAILKISRDEEIKNFKLEFDFGQSNEDDENAEPVDFSGQTPLGPCPKCGSGVYEMGLAYVCEKMVARPKACDFRSGRIILQQEILPEQMAKLLGEPGKTDLLPGFVSQRTRRPFKAYLSRGKDGKVSFEFEARKGKPAAKSSAKSDDEAEVAVKRPAAKTAGKTAAKAPAKKVAAKKIPTKTVAKKAAPKKVAAKKVVAKKAVAKKAVARKVA
jgi:DNA topoisomerase-3